MGHIRVLKVADEWGAPRTDKAISCEQSVPSCPGGLPHKEDWPVKMRPSSSITLPMPLTNLSFRERFLTQEAM